MKPICKSFNELIHDEKSFAYNLFLICSSISLLTISCVALFKFINEHCCRKYEYTYDNECSCGCQDNKCE